MLYKLELNSNKFNADVDIVFYDEKGSVSPEYGELLISLKENNRLNESPVNVTLVNEKIKDVIFIPFHSENSLDYWRDNISLVSNICYEKKFNNVTFIFNEGLLDQPFVYDICRITTEIFILAQYRFKKYLSTKEEDLIKTLNFSFNSTDEKIGESLSEGLTLGSSTAIVRELVNIPSNKQSPIEYFEELKSLFKDTKVAVRCITKADMKDLGMSAILKVSQGSINEPVLILLEYKTDASRPRIGLIGKGITYDSGGLSLKSKDRMITMHHDMAGSASVVGALLALDKQGKSQNLIGILPVCENLIATDGYRPGDIIEMMNGKTVLINSTDAEGRLVIADAIHYAVSLEKVDEIIDIASLTGGARMAYGPFASAYAIDKITPEMQKKLELASCLAGEKIWQMPLFEEYMEMLKTEHADIANTGDGSKMIGGALFIKEFTASLPWIHIDIAGTCWSSKNIKYYSYGGTGAGVRLLYHYLG